MSEDFKRVDLFEADCGDCVIKVEGWGPWKDESGWAYVSVLTSGYPRGLRYRLKRAWDALRGIPEEYFMVTEAETMDTLIQALVDAKAKAFPSSE